jgi:hypothetical protein
MTNRSLYIINELKFKFDISGLVSYLKKTEPLLSIVNSSVISSLMASSSYIIQNELTKFMQGKEYQGCSVRGYVLLNAHEIDADDIDKFKGMSEVYNNVTNQFSSKNIGGLILFNKIIVTNNINAILMMYNTKKVLVLSFNKSDFNKIDKLLKDNGIDFIVSYKRDHSPGENFVKPNF